MVFRDPQMVQVFTAPALASPASRHQRHIQKPQARYSRDRPEQRSQGGMGGTKPLTFHTGQAQ